MYICDGCGNPSAPGEPRHSWVAEARKKRYALLDKKGERLGVVTGSEVVREVGLCSRCIEAARQADVYRSQDEVA